MRFTHPLLFHGIAMAFAVVLAGLPARVSPQSLVPGYPNDVRSYDPREVGRLPVYCRYTEGFRDRYGKDAAQLSYWQSTMPTIFHGMHHYCWGLMKLNRALYLARTPQVRTFYFGDAIGEFDYILDRTSKDFVLRPEILTKKGQSLIGLGRGPVAVLILEEAIALKPDYWPSYVQLSDYYKQSGQLDLAREVLEKALVHSPDVKSLKLRLAELDTSGEKQGKIGK